MPRFDFALHRAARELEQRREDARRSNWTKQKIEQARKEAPEGRELEAEARVIKAEVERRAALILKHPEWAEIWGVEIVVEREDETYLHRSSGLDHIRRHKPLIASILSSVASCDWYVRKGWEWTIDEIFGERCQFRVERFDSCAAGEKLIIRATRPLPIGGGSMILEVDFVGGRQIHIFEPNERLFDAYYCREQIQIDDLKAGKFGCVVPNASTGEMWQ